MIHDKCKAFERGGVIRSLTHSSMDEQDTVCTKSVAGMYDVIWQYRILNATMTGISNLLASSWQIYIMHLAASGMQVVNEWISEWTMDSSICDLLPFAE